MHRDEPAEPASHLDAALLAYDEALHRGRVAAAKAKTVSPPSPFPISSSPHTPTRSTQHAPSRVRSTAARQSSELTGAAVPFVPVPFASPNVDRRLTAAQHQMPPPALITAYKSFASTRRRASEASIRPSPLMS